jgi:parallel beta-helix repeat protein
MFPVYTFQPKLSAKTALFSSVSHSLTPHEPILIDEEADFTFANGVTNGSGTVSDPYVIEGWDINASEGHGISVRDTEAHFVIRNVLVHDGYPKTNDGILLFNVTNGKVENVTALRNYNGLALRYSYKNILQANNVSNNRWYGISLDKQSCNNTISCNVVINNTDSIRLEELSSNNIILENNVSKNLIGILIVNSSQNTICKNKVTKNTDGIVFDYYSSANQVFDNYVTENLPIGTGIRIEHGENNTIYNNFLNNTYNAYDAGNNNWNTTKKPGPNIVGGPYVGGNYYHNYIGSDIDMDGFGDTPFSISGGNQKDYLPLVLNRTMPINIPPSANFTYTPLKPMIGENVQFLDESYDSDGNVTTWFWGFGDGSNSYEQNPVHQFMNSGAYNVTLSVEDDQGAVGTVKKTIIIERPADSTGYIIYLVYVIGIISVAIALVFVLIKIRKRSQRHGKAIA